MPPFEIAAQLGRHAARFPVAAGAAMLLATTAALVAWAADTFDPDAQPVGWVARPALSSQSLISGKEVIFQPQYRAGLWTGTVSAENIDAKGKPTGNSPWGDDDNTASAMDTAETDYLAANKGTSDTSKWRRVVTLNSSGAGVPFQPEKLDASQLAALGGATNGPAMARYIRGDRKNEAPNGLKFRSRPSLQGDTLHSSLVYWRHSSTVERLYVGGNDGMLHVFDASNGSEVYAYIPSMLIPRLPALAAIPFEHNLYVDGGLNVSDVLVKDSRGATKTKTWLAGALGGGGRGLFMLDVTDPTATTEAAAATTIKWEISSANRDFANLGYTYAAPHQARLNTGEAAVVVGNGYMNTGNGQASLFIINADTGALIREISTGSGRTGSPNGLSTATLVDFDLDGKVDFAYAGDIDGNLWRFDLRGNAAKAWSVTKVLATSPAQAITSAPVVVNHPKGGRMVLFGTGRVLNAADTKDTASYFAYGRWDGAPAANTTWKDQTITEVKADGSRARRVSQNVPKWTSGGDMGWRLKLTAGERIIGEGMYVSGERFSFTTSNPTVASAAADQPTGANWLMEVNALTGGGFPTAIFDVDENGKINAGDNSDTGVVAGHYLGAGVTSQPVLVDLATLSRTLFNLESNVDYTPPPPAPLPLPPPPVPVGGGVSGGHFDVDLYTFGGGYGNVKHTHQYDDVYDVTGVNMLNASDSTFNIGTQLGSTVPFKVLVMNQYLNPALTLSVGGGPYVNVKTYGGLTTAPTATVALAALPSYTLSNVKTLVWNLPLDAFQSKDWWGDGGAVRAGLIPTETKCVNHVEADGTTNRLGANGERFNGALTIQLIKSNTPASALELNYPGGGAKYGWRVTRSEFSNYVLAEYTTFWHHPAHSCYGDGDWVPNPPEDFDEGKGHGKSSEKESGSSDPVGGTYGVDSTGPGTGPGTSGPAPVGVTVVKHTKVKRNSVIIETIVYSDGKRHVTTTVINGDGTEKVTTIDRDGNKTVGIRVTASTIGEAPDETRLDSRRINWREVVRP